MENTREKEHFYDELDKTRAHKSCCTCGGLILFFISLLILSAGGIFYLYWQLSHESFSPIKFPTSKMLAGLVEKVKWPEGSPEEITVVVSDEELSALLNDGISFDNIVFKDIRSEISLKDITIFGSLKPFDIDTQMVVLPAIQDGKIIFAVKDIKTKSFLMPDFVVKKLDQNLNGFLNAKLSLFYDKMTIDEIRLGNGQMILKGRAK